MQLYRATASSEIQRSGYSAVRLVPRETAAVSAHALSTQYNHAPVYSFTGSHTRRVHVCIAVTCYLHLCLSGRDLYVL